MLKLTFWPHFLPALLKLTLFDHFLFSHGEIYFLTTPIFTIHADTDLIEHSHAETDFIDHAPSIHHQTPSQLVSELFSSCYQMRLCRIWSRNAENSPVLFSVTKSNVFQQKVTFFSKKSRFQHLLALFAHFAKKSF
jgi:hypothetical protein